MKLPASWQRQLLSLLGIGVIVLNWRWATGHIYSLPTDKLPAFISITNNTHYVIGIIVIWAVTGKTITDFRMGAGLSRFFPGTGDPPPRDTPADDNDARD